MSPPKAATSFTTVEVEVRILQRGNQKRGIYFRFQNAVRLCHLQFIFKVCDRAESADDRMRLAFLRKINSEPAERTDFDIWNVLGRFL